MSRDVCGCPIEDGLTLHGFDGPCAHDPQQQPGPTVEDYCAADGHVYAGDDGGRGRCYCGRRTFDKEANDA